MTHAQMCFAEGGKYLQKGMNFKPYPRVSVLLMSRRAGALYTDRIEDEGKVLIYQGHDIRPTEAGPEPKSVDQPLILPTGKATDNGRFFEAAQSAKAGAPPHRVHVYEKLRPNLWVFNGAFRLIDAWIENEKARKVCKFKLQLEDGEGLEHPEQEHTRLIPADVKVQVWERDGGRCTQCGSQENLHFDHIIPFSKGGTSLLASNIQLLCARHNLRKHDRIA